MTAKPLQPKIYALAELSRYYDALYDYKDYRAEAAVVTKLIGQYKQSSGKDLLDVACGTGKHLQYLKRRFACTGVDKNRSILAAARGNISGVKFRQADMADLSLGRQFDAITCLFSSIGYVRTLSNLRRTMLAFATHLKPGGVIIIEPWFTPARFRDRITHVSPFETPTVTGVRVMRSVKHNKLSTLEGHYVISTNRGPLKHYRDSHSLGLFTIKEQLAAMEAAGLKAKSLNQQLGLFKRGVRRRSPKYSRGLLVGQKPMMPLTSP